MENKIGKNMRKLRLDKGYTQKEVAEGTGLNHIHVNQIERGVKKDITVGTAKKLAQFFKVSVDKLIK